MKKAVRWQKIEKNVFTLYPEDAAQSLLHSLSELIEQRSAAFDAAGEQLSEQRFVRPELTDVALICYADSIRDTQSEQVPLRALNDFLTRYSIPEVMPLVHLLPFFPWDTDRGFSVKDYSQVDSACGDWSDIAALGESVKLMFDFVANHASIENPLVQNALIERHLDHSDTRYGQYAPYKNFVIAFSAEDKPSEAELSKLSRPRSNPVLTPYTVQEYAGKLTAVLGEATAGATPLGSGLVWTTFSREKSSDGEEETRQVDLNFQNHELFLETIRILLFYVDRHASVIRLDAIGYIWKKLGKSSLHEPEAHTLLEVVKDVLALSAPHVCTIAEVNEPQDRFFEYLGDAGHEESDLVYQFTHFPLAVHAVTRGSGAYYRDWLNTLDKFEGRQFTTVLGSHDGMGMKPVRGILPEEEIDAFLSVMIDDHGGLPNFAFLPGGKKIVYEVCATPWNLINSSQANETLELQLARYRAVIALGLLVRGIPALYINGVIGATNFTPANGLDENRTVNRESFELRVLEDQLRNETGRMRRVLEAVRHILAVRGQYAAFDAAAPAATVCDAGSDALVAAQLQNESGDEGLIVVVNVSAQARQMKLGAEWLEGVASVEDVLQKRSLAVESSGLLVETIEPYGIRWLVLPSK
jgi:sucrose phosphorylase